jgi:uncharacterized RDD family membrane protein YckC
VDAPPDPHPGAFVPGDGPPPPPGYGPTRFVPPNAGPAAAMAPAYAPGYRPPPGYGPPGYSYGPAIGYGYPQWIGPPPWKGAQYGRPVSGPGSLAHPGRRLVARLIDWLVLLPIGILLVAGFLTLVGATTFSGTKSDPGLGVFVLEIGVYGLIIIEGALQVLYETMAIGRYGRTLGKACMHIRPLCEDGGKVTMTRAFFRSLCAYMAWFINCLGLLDPLWCLWDQGRQCLHDKIASTIVVND